MLGMCWRIGEAKRHHKEFEVAVMRLEGGLVDIIRLHADLVISRAQIELGEEASALEFIHKFLHHQDGKLILYRLFVEGTVVHTKLP